ncbi:hypothetical protein N5C12_01225 [Comamonas aquatica]|uniref:hypothetical protein n=1 Tax=Comamonas aquatica TaxID=225991 RepID=UPI00244BBC6D|nr:hypothetical protein [Comamonas aquatica]MDH0897983.1 hypothetical protein [Comamonas aquatica]
MHAVAVRHPKAWCAGLRQPTIPGDTPHRQSAGRLTAPLARGTPASSIRPTFKAGVHAGHSPKPPPLDTCHHR